MLAELLETMHDANLCNGFLLGDLCGIIEEGPKEHSLQRLFDSLKKWCENWEKIEATVRKEWERRGKPLSLRQQQREKAICDKRDEEKEAYER